jgi:hypothetical protein
VANGKICQKFTDSSATCVAADFVIVIFVEF